MKSQFKIKQACQAPSHSAVVYDGVLYIGVHTPVSKRCQWRLLSSEKNICNGCFIVSPLTTSLCIKKKVSMIAAIK